MSSSLQVRRYSVRNINMGQCSCIKQKCWCQTTFFFPETENKSVIIQEKEIKLTYRSSSNTLSNWLQSFCSFCRNELLWGAWSVNWVKIDPQLRYQCELDVRFNVVHQKNILKGTAKRLSYEETTLRGPILY